MKKMLTLCAMITGAFMLLVGTSSCKDDAECCEWTDSDNYTYKACEDDAFIESTNSWGYVLSNVQEYGGSCD